MSEFTATSGRLAPDDPRLRVKRGYRLVGYDDFRTYAQKGRSIWGHLHDRPPDKWDWITEAKVWSPLSSFVEISPVDRDATDAPRREPTGDTARERQAMEVLEAGGYFRKALEAAYQGGEKFQTRLRAANGAVVPGIGEATKTAFEKRGLLVRKDIPTGSTWPTEWRLANPEEQAARAAAAALAEQEREAQRLELAAKPVVLLGRDADTEYGRRNGDIVKRAVGSSAGWEYFYPVPAWENIRSGLKSFVEATSQEQVQRRQTQSAAQEAVMASIADPAYEPFAAPARPEPSRGGIWHGKAKAMTLFHETSPENAERILVEGFKVRPNSSAGWYTLTDTLKGVEAYLSEGHVVLQFDLPVEAVEKYVWPNGVEWQDGRQWAVRETIPSQYIKLLPAAPAPVESEMATPNDPTPKILGRDDAWEYAQTYDGTYVRRSVHRTWATVFDGWESLVGVAPGGWETYSRLRHGPGKRLGEFRPEGVGPAPRAPLASAPRLESLESQLKANEVFLQTSSGTTDRGEVAAAANLVPKLKAEVHERAREIYKYGAAPESAPTPPVAPRLLKYHVTIRGSLAIVTALSVDDAIAEARQVLRDQAGAVDRVVRVNPDKSREVIDLSAPPPSVAEQLEAAARAETPAEAAARAAELTRLLEQNDRNERARAMAESFQGQTNVMKMGPVVSSPALKWKVTLARVGFDTGPTWNVVSAPTVEDAIRQVRALTGKPKALVESVIVYDQAGSGTPVDLSMVDVAAVAPGRGSDANERLPTMTPVRSMMERAPDGGWRPEDKVPEGMQRAASVTSKGCPDCGTAMVKLSDTAAAGFSGAVFQCPTCGPSRKSFIPPVGAQKVHMAKPGQRVTLGATKAALCGRLVKETGLSGGFTDDAEKVTCSGCRAKLGAVVGLAEFDPDSQRSADIAAFLMRVIEAAGYRPLKSTWGRMIRGKQGGVGFPVLDIIVATTEDPRRAVDAELERYKIPLIATSWTTDEAQLASIPEAKGKAWDQFDTIRFQFDYNEDGTGRTQLKEVDRIRQDPKVLGMMNERGTTPGARAFIVYPRRADESFPAVYRSSLKEAIEAGMATGFPFDVHSSSGAILWTYEQRPDVKTGGSLHAIWTAMEPKFRAALEAETGLPFSLVEIDGPSEAGETNITWHSPGKGAFVLHGMEGSPRVQLFYSDANGLPEQPRETNVKAGKFSDPSVLVKLLKEYAGKTQWTRVGQVIWKETNDRNTGVRVDIGKADHGQYQLYHPKSGPSAGKTVLRYYPNGMSPMQDMGAFADTYDGRRAAEAHNAGMVAQAVGDRPPMAEEAVAIVRPSLRDIAQRQVDGDQNFVDVLMQLGGISKEEAQRVFETYKANGFVKRDAGSGRWSVKHGAHLDRDAIRRALGSVAEESEEPEQDVASIILEQLGGMGRLRAMLSARDFAKSENSLTFKWPNKDLLRGNTLKITLDPSDTYTMQFYAVRGGQSKLVKEFTDVYADQLTTIFRDWTGWAMRL